MSEMVKVVVDAMGGDNAPEEPVKAAVEAVKEKENIQVILTGVQDVIEAELRKYPDYPKDRIRVVHASQVIETAEPPVMAIQKKKDSSIVVGLNLVKKQKGNALCRRDQRSKRWSPDSLDPAYDHLASYQYRTGASGGNKGIGLLFFYKI